MDLAPGSGQGVPDPDTDPDRLLASLYDELRRIARHHLRDERPDHTLQPTALVHEAWLKLGVGGAPRFESRSHFLHAASRAMRHILVDHARGRNAAKRSGGVRVTLDEGMAGAGPDVDLLALDDALEHLAQAEPRWARVVELRFFAGLEMAEIAALLEVSPATAKRDWRFARAWLARELDLAMPAHEGDDAG